MSPDLLCECPESKCYGESLALRRGNLKKHYEDSGAACDDDDEEEEDDADVAKNSQVKVQSYIIRFHSGFQTQELYDDATNATQYNSFHMTAYPCA